MSEISQLEERVLDMQQKQLDNLAADQRRLWDLVHAMQMVESARVGRGKVLTGIAHFLSAGMGAAVTWLATWLAGKGH
jgi:hypothetical protein